jgi:hypothetical protein
LGAICQAAAEGHGIGQETGAMTTRHVFRVVSLVVAAFGTVLLVQTGRLALALGAVVRADTASASPTVAFWYQLSFMRLFGVALLALATLCLWAASQLSENQQRSLGQILGGVFGFLVLMAVAQQVAIWGAMTGWAVAGTFGVVAAMFGLSTLARVSRPAA